MTDRAYAADVATAMTRSLDLPRLAEIVEADVAKAVADPRIAGAKRIVMGGSGDSWFAATSTVPALRRWTGLPVEARTAMELARYEAPLLGPTDLVVSISNSGSSSRAREAVLLAKDPRRADLGRHRQLDGAARAAGRPRLAPTGARDVRRPAELRPLLPQHGRVVRGAVCAVSLRTGARRRARRADGGGGGGGAGSDRRRDRPRAGDRGDDRAEGRGARGDSGRHRDDLDDRRGARPRCRAVLRGEIPRADADQRSGDGPRGMGASGILPDARVGAPRSVVFVLAPPGNGLDRAREITTGVAGAGGRAVVVTSGAGGFEDAVALFDLGDVGSEWISPLTYHLPTQLLVLHMAARAGVAAIPLKRHDGAFLIAKGLVRASTDGLG